MGASIFYHSPPESETQKSDDVSALDSELKSGAKNVKEAEKEQQNLSSLVILLFSLVFCYQNCSDLLCEKIVLVISKKF